MARPEELGKELESDVQKILEDLKSRYLVYVDRIYDSKSTGVFSSGGKKGYLPPRPGDFLVGYYGKSAILECKASEVNASLRNGLSKLVKDEQVAELRLWLRAGNGGFYLFRNEIERVVEVWHAHDVVAAKLGTKKLTDDMCYLRLHSDNLELALRKIFVEKVA